MANKKRKQSQQQGRSSTRTTRTETQGLRLNEPIANHQAEADEIQDIEAGHGYKSSIPPCKDCIAVMALDPEEKWRLMHVQQALKEAEAKLGPRSLVIDQLRQDQMEACRAIREQTLEKNVTQQGVFNGEALHQRIMRLESNAFRSGDLMNKRINRLQGELNKVTEQIGEDK
ncbi:uncharacterized protein FMAN_15455 [Fusarium mangiferae]|uniref:Uncharacterized protein n=1 Tax=Fusarium mangiferae TaxID=192010 RepID=A0A1L7UL71_FUSMA|nr:uncharacterized protein FMAN_15455 [Fusarium mangiferae]CVL09213.1 uncharacterized protein FMAN_15455 [Fusarium mangiferae]